MRRQRNPILQAPIYSQVPKHREIPKEIAHGPANWLGPTQSVKLNFFTDANEDDEEDGGVDVRCVDPFPQVCL